MRTALNRYLNDDVDTIGKLRLQTIDQLVEVLMQSYESGAMIYRFGNRGSAALASHFACELINFVRPGDIAFCDQRQWKISECAQGLEGSPVRPTPLQSASPDFDAEI
jgi:hypothetical protein